MALPLVQKIAEASKAAWPVVSASINATMRSAQELAGIAEEVVPQVEEYVARSEGSVRRRKICEETVWALANMGWLRTGAEREIIRAAKTWVDTDPEKVSEKTLAVIDDELVAAVRNAPDFILEAAS